MKKEVIQEALSTVSDRHIEEACEYRKSGRKWLIAASAAVFALAVTAVMLIGFGGRKPTPHAENISGTDSPTLHINRDDVMVAMADMDIQIEWYDVNDIKSETTDSFSERVGVSYSDFISRIPEGCEIKFLWSYLARWDENGVRHEEYSPFDYRFELSTPSGGRIVMAVCGVGEPLRDCIVKCDGAVPSEIDGVEMYIYEVLGEYYVIFESGGIYYDIEAELSSDEELVRFIESMI